MQFTSFVMLSQLWRELIKESLVLNEKFANNFKERFSVLSMGNYTWMIRSIGYMFDENNIEWFMPEMGENFNKKFYTALDFWAPERNEIGHYQINLTQEEIERRCIEYEDKLTFILEKLAFLTKYKLVSVREIKVDKKKNKEAIFNHFVDLLNSVDSDFKAKEINENKCTESRAVLLMKSIKSIDEYLNLSPVIIDTSCEVIDSKEKLNIKKDIFMFTKFRNNQIFFLGTEVTQKCDLRPLSNYNEMVQEFNDFFDVFSNTKKVSEVIKN